MNDYPKIWYFVKPIYTRALCEPRGFGSGVLLDLFALELNMLLSLRILRLIIY
jgi:hypothetical protein